MSSYGAVIAGTRARVRLMSIDILRGLVIVLMALDHVRAYFTGVRFDPLDLTQTSAPLYVTRWITHFCAPIFVFLAGTSSWLVSKRLTKAELSRFLLTRGFWLVVLEFTVVRFAWMFNFSYLQFGLIMQVIWAIGASMIVLALLVHLPLRAIGAIGVFMIAGHNLLDGISPERFGAWAPLWNVIHVSGQTPFGFVAYPLVPWIGVMAAGYAIGTVFDMDAQRRCRILIALGLSLIGIFVVLRLVDVYGDPRKWSAHSSILFTALSFLNVSKYPPSLFYLLVTLGPALVLLALLESAQGRFARVLATFGRVPLFFYVLHIALAHLLAGIVAYAMGYGTTLLTGIFFTAPPEWGFGLPVVYLAWACVLVLLYPLCRSFAGVKQRRGEWWLSYL